MDTEGTITVGELVEQACGASVVDDWQERSEDWQALADQPAADAQPETWTRVGVLLTAEQQGQVAEVLAASEVPGAGPAAEAVAVPLQEVSVEEVLAATGAEPAELLPAEELAEVQGVTVAALPDEVWALVFSRLNEHQVRKVMALPEFADLLGQKDFRDVTATEKLLPTPGHSSFTQINSAQALPDALGPGAEAQSLAVWFALSPADQELIHQAFGDGRLYRLELHDGATLTNHTKGTVNVYAGGTVTGVTGGEVSVSAGGTVTGVTGGGRVNVFDGGTVTGVTGGQVDVYGGTVTGVTGGTVQALEGGTVTGVTGGLVHVREGGTVTGVTGGQVNVFTGGTVTLGEGVVLERIGNDTARGPGLSIYGYSGLPFVLLDAQGNQLYPPT